MKHILDFVDLTDFVYVDVDCVAFPPAEEFNFVARETVGCCGNCCSFSEGMAGEAATWDGCSEEHFFDFLDEVLSVEGTMCAGE